MAREGGAGGGNWQTNKLMYDMKTRQREDQLQAYARDNKFYLYDQNAQMDDILGGTANPYGTYDTAAAAEAAYRQYYADNPLHMKGNTYYTWDPFKLNFLGGMGEDDGGGWPPDITVQRPDLMEDRPGGSPDTIRGQRAMRDNMLMRTMGEGLGQQGVGGRQNQSPGGANSFAGLSWPNVGWQDNMLNSDDRWGEFGSRRGL